MKKTVLDRNELKLQKEIEKGRWAVVENLDAELIRYRKLAHQTLNKNKKINIRLSDWDYEKIKIQAVQEGLPYQSLITSLIHKYLTGRLKAA